MELVKLIETAMKSGDAKVVARSESLVSEILDHIKVQDPKKYDCYYREMHEIINGPHYTEELAEEDVKALRYTDASGNALEGPHWTKAQILSATSALEFPKGTTDCDKYVAFNAAYADFCKKFSEEQIIYIAYLFYFKDEDWKSEGKVWSYMKSNR